MIGALSVVVLLFFFFVLSDSEFSERMCVYDVKLSLRVNVSAVFSL